MKSRYIVAIADYMAMNKLPCLGIAPCTPGTLAELKGVPDQEFRSLLRINLEEVNEDMNKIKDAITNRGAMGIVLGGLVNDFYLVDEVSGYSFIGIDTRGQVTKLEMEELSVGVIITKVQASVLRDLMRL
jgi:hypothetical protein